MTRKIQQHHVATLLKSTGLVADLGRRALSAGDCIHADLEFLTKFANLARDVQVMPPGEWPQNVQSAGSDMPYYFTPRQAEILRDGLRLVQFNPRRHEDIATAERIARYLRKESASAEDAGGRTERDDKTEGDST